MIEVLSGDPYQVYIQKNIFAPLAMTRTYFNSTPYYLAKDRTTSYSIYLDAKGGTNTFVHPREFNTGITTSNGGLTG